MTTEAVGKLHWCCHSPWCRLGLRLHFGLLLLDLMILGVAIAWQVQAFEAPGGQGSLKGRDTRGVLKEDAVLVQCLVGRAAALSHGSFLTRASCLRTNDLRGELALGNARDV